MPEEHELQMSLTMPESLLAGVYANMAQVSHSPHEFTIDFFVQSAPGPMVSEDGENVLPMVGVARVRLPDTVIFELARAISHNVTIWEEQTGRRIPSSSGPAVPPDFGGAGPT